MYAASIPEDYGYDTVKILLDNEADPKIKNLSGKTATYYASALDNEEVMTLLPKKSINKIMICILTLIIGFLFYIVIKPRKKSIYDNSVN